MKYEIFFLIFSSTLTLTSYCQDNGNKKLDFKDIDTFSIKQKVAYIDSIPIINQLKTYEFADRVDEKWIKSLYQSPLYNSNTTLLTEQELLDFNFPEFTTDTLKKRLEKLSYKTPLPLEYNPILERFIKSYLKNRKGFLTNLIQKSYYYFPLFEEKLAKYNLPIEIKYLAVVESALQPKASSHMGARGIWQMMYYTGKQYGLNVSSYVDDRSDIIKSTEAACKYLEHLYKIFGDWDLVLAAYNSGPGNVNKAIRRSGGHKNYWNIRMYLPRETADYLPAFYANLYIFEYAKEHNLLSSERFVNLFEVDTVHIKKMIHFDHIVKVTGIDREFLEFLNPQYKLDIIPYKKGSPYYLRLPLKELGLFVSNENKIYAFAQEEFNKREKPLPQYYEYNDRIRYRVQKGDYLGKIANKFGVRVKQLQQWNNLKGNTIIEGQHLTLYPYKR